MTYYRPIFDESKKLTLTLNQKEIQLNYALIPFQEQFIFESHAVFGVHLPLIYYHKANNVEL